MHLLRLLPLLAAPLLGGCTLTLGFAGASIDNVSARQPGTVYTVEAPPPLGAPVEVVTRDGRDAAGRWAGMDTAIRAEATPIAEAVSESVVVLDRGRASRVEVPAAQVAQIRSRPTRRHTFVPFLMAGLVIDGLIVKAVIDSVPCMGGC